MSFAVNAEIESYEDKSKLKNKIIQFDPSKVSTKRKLAPLSEKQLDFIRKSNAPINIAHGGVRAGKNFAIDVRLIRYFKEEPAGDMGSLFAIIGATKATVKRNVLTDLEMLVGKSNFKYNSQSGEGTVFGRPFQVFDFKDKKSIEKLRGSTLGGALITECSFCPQEVFDEVMRRLTDDDAKLFIDTNPDNPYHWLFTDYINNPDKISEGIVKVWHFTYRDNLSLGLGYIKKLLSIFKEGTLKFQRFVQGLWVAGEGTIFDNFTPGRHIINWLSMPDLSVMKSFIITLDPGTINAFAGLKVGIKDGYYYVFDEYYWDSQREAKQKTEGEYCKDIAKFSENTKKPLVVVDPSRASFKTEIRKNFNKFQSEYNINTGGIELKDAYNDVLTGIDVINSLFAQDRIVISSKCKNLIQQISNYVWDKAAANRGIEQPLKVLDHTCDAFRYGIVTHYKMANNAGVKDVKAVGKVSHNPNDY